MTTLDLSLLPKPDFLDQLSFDTVLEDIKADLGERMPELIPSLALESTVVSKVVQAFAYRETLLRGRVNDAGQALLLAFAVKGDLEHLGAFYGVTRRVIQPASGGTPAVLEPYPEFRRRVLVAMEAFAAAGPVGAYIFHALSSDPRVLNADVWSPGPGKVSVAIQQRDGAAAASDELVEAVRRYLNRDDIKPLTDMVLVRSVEVIPYTISLKAYVRPGPDKTIVKGLIENAVAAMAASRRLPARDVPRSAIISAAMVGPVDQIDLLSPISNIVRGNGELAVCSSIAVEVLEHEG